MLNLLLVFFVWVVSLSIVVSVAFHYAGVSKPKYEREAIFLSAATIVLSVLASSIIPLY